MRDGNGTFLGIPVHMSSDAARRAADQINVHILALGHEAFGRWVAIRLSDGGSDGVLYDSREHAIGHQLHESQCAYFRIPPFGQTITASEAECVLTYTRSIYDAGYRVQSPADPAPITPLIPVAAPRRGAKVAWGYRGEWK